MTTADMTTGRPGTEAADPAETRRVLDRRSAFWLIAMAMMILLFASSAPSPLYVVYQAQWHFSAITLTSVFAVYALVLLVALIITGGLSDAIGRRPVLAAGFALEAVAMVLFAVASGTGWLYGARATQGLATAIATGALSATLIDLRPDDNPELAPLVNSSAPGIGLAVGALGTGLLVQYAPAPTRLIFIVLAVIFAGLTVAIPWLPEPVLALRPVRDGLRPRLGIPADGRRGFLAALPSLIAVWALGGLYFSLGPSVLSGLLGDHDHLAGGFLLFVFSGSSAAAAIAMRRATAATAMLAGCAALIVGMVASLLSLGAGTELGFFAGTLVAGTGFGVAFLGAFRNLSALASAEQRSALVASVYTVSYLAFSLPAIAAGIAVTHVGLREAVNVYGLGIAGLAVVALGGFAVESQHRRQHGHQPIPAH